MAITTNVPSNNFEDLQRDVQDATRFTNATAPFTNRVGQSITPIPLRDAEISSKVDQVSAAAADALEIIEEAGQQIPDAVRLIGGDWVFYTDISTVPQAGLVEGNRATDLDSGQQFIWAFYEGTSTGFWSPITPSYGAPSHQSLPGRNGPSRHFASDISLSAGGSVQQAISYVTPEMLGVASLDTLRGLLLKAPRSNRFCSEFIQNGRNDTRSLIDYANFAGQTNYGSEPIGWVYHHYTDGEGFRFDNVGSGPSIKVVNSTNPFRRPDRPSNYVGTGNFIEFRENGTNTKNFFVNKDVEFVWQNRGGKFVSGKDNTGGFAFTMEAYGTHNLMWQLITSSSRLIYIGDSTGMEGRCDIVCERPNGLRISAEKSLLRLKTMDNGSIVLESGADGYIQNSGSGDLKLEGGGTAKAVRAMGPIKLRQYTNVSAMPVLGANERAIAWDKQTEKMVIWNGSAWV